MRNNPPRVIYHTNEVSLIDNGAGHTIARRCLYYAIVFEAGQTTKRTFNRESFTAILNKQVVGN